MIGETDNTAGVSPPQPPPKSKPTTIQVPPRALLYASGSVPGFSPGPMTLVSNLFPEQSPFSFSQLLAGAIASPASAPAATPSPSPNPLFILNSPGYLSPLQSPFGMSHQQALAHVTAQAVLSQSFKQMQAELHHSSSRKPEPPLEISPPEKKSGEHNKVVGDGYNWRKYGQKQVKASEGPRSYYKCSQPNCSVKKKIERGLDGSVLEVTYKGEHNHDFPKQNKRGKESKDSFVETDCGSKEALSNVHSESTPKTLFEHHGVNADSCPKEDEDEDEPLAKRKSLDSGPPLPIPDSSLQAVSETKIVLQTRSEVDLLDDGYKWRKYGQKVVKGNPYPRSYYKCTYGGCNVRKHVERASVDPKAVITSYEGKHNHEIPTRRCPNAKQMRIQKNKVSKNALTEEENDYGDNNNDDDKINSNIAMNLQIEQGQVTA